jgi:hypothetical protein
VTESTKHLEELENGPNKTMKRCRVLICEKKLIFKFITPFNNVILLHGHIPSPVYWGEKRQ